MFSELYPISSAPCPSPPPSTIAMDTIFFEEEIENVV